MRNFVASIAGVFLVMSSAHAVITVKTPLSAIQESSTYIFVGKVEKFLPDKPAMIVQITEDIKSKAPFRQLLINCKVDEKAAKENQIEPLMKRLGADLDIVFFCVVRGKSYVPTFAFTNGTWFQIHGTKAEGDNVVFKLKSAEPYFRKTYRGTTEELRKLLKDHAAGKATLPAHDDKVAPGLGPEYAPQKRGDKETRRQGDKETRRQGDRETRRQGDKETRRQGDKETRRQGDKETRQVSLSPCLLVSLSSSGQLFGVIPTLGIGAPLAILALLFPAIFGGVFVLFRQWLAFITALSINSTLLLLHLWLKQSVLRGTWWGNDAALWLVMTVGTALCVVWAWRRQLHSLAAGEEEASRRTELLLLVFMSICCLATAGITWRLSQQISWSDAGWTLTIVMSAGILAGTLHRAWTAYRSSSLFGAPPLPTEGVILGTFLLGHLVFVPAIWGSSINTEGKVETNEGAGKSTKIGAVVKKWDFTVEPKGMYASSPLVDGDAVYASYSETGTQLATLVRLDRHTGVKKWEFLGKNDDLRQMISTPCIADGKLYFGEGFHDDKNCRVFCVDAEKGEEIWSFTTGGQTESSPAVAKGKVYIGAGNEGVYCLDAKSGKEIWKFPPKDYRGRLLRFGGGMLIVGDKLYCASGVDRNQAKDKGETTVFCIDAANGKQLWKAPAPYPVWSKPIVKDGFAYISTGNGDVFDDAQPPDVPGGALLCLDADTGKEKWRFKTPNGIIESPAVDEGRVYFGCRDGQIYCVGRADGKERWTHFLDSPLIATPVLDIDPSQKSISVFALAAAGKVCCLNPQSGDIVWTYDLTAQRAYISTSPALVVTRTKEESRRRLYFGVGLGGGTRDLAANVPVFYCLEDSVKVE